LQKIIKFLVKANEIINEENKLEYLKKISFHPTFSYPLFGFEEKIYGYKNLKIQVSLFKYNILIIININILLYIFFFDSTKYN